MRHKSPVVKGLTAARRKQWVWNSNAARGSSRPNDGRVKNTDLDSVSSSSDSDRLSSDSGRLSSDDGSDDQWSRRG